MPRANKVTMMQSIVVTAIGSTDPPPRRNRRRRYGSDMCCAFVIRDEGITYTFFADGLRLLDADISLRDPLRAGYRRTRKGGGGEYDAAGDGPEGLRAAAIEAARNVARWWRANREETNR